MSRPSIFARVKARFVDWRRECRIQFHFDEARFAELRGFSETQRFHAIAMRNEMNARSSGQLRRMNMRQHTTAARHLRATVKWSKFQSPADWK